MPLKISLWICEQTKRELGVFPIFYMIQSVFYLCVRAF